VARFGQALLDVRWKFAVEVVALAMRMHPNASEDDVIKSLASPLPSDELTAKEIADIQALEPRVIKVGKGAWRTVNQRLARECRALAIACDARKLDPAVADELASDLERSSTTAPTAGMLQMAKRVEALAARLERAAGTPPTKAAAGLTPDGRILLRRLVQDYPNAVKVRDIKPAMPPRLRADRALNRELQLLREMQPPLASKAERSGYHVATEDGCKVAKKRGIGQ